MDQSTSPQNILVCGSGLAAQMTVAALSAHAPAYMRITWLKIPDTAGCDVLYGNVAPPSAYDFNLSLGSTNPRSSSARVSPLPTEHTMLTGEQTAGRGFRPSTRRFRS